MKKLAAQNKIYTNRSLNLESIKSIGFDMDHTLAVYNREKFESLAFRETVKKFIEAGYPQELAKLKFDPNFVIRGLLVDRNRGNLLKVDGHKYVKIAFHGKQRLTKKERHETYNRDGIKAEDFLSIDTFFALSEVQLFIEIVDYMRLNPGVVNKSFVEVYDDLRDFIDLSHRDGSIKNEVLANLSEYFYKDHNTAKTLIGLREAGKKVFLLTNSHYSYTESVMSYLLNDEDEDHENWKDYFDYIIVGGSKPNFFTGNNPFFEVVEPDGLLKPHSGSLKKGKIYHGGNARLLQRIENQIGDEILYVGDHIFGDIMRSKELFNWRTVLIVEELNDELKALANLEAEIANLKDGIESEAFLIESEFALKQQIRQYEKRDSKIGLSDEEKTQLDEKKAKYDILHKQILDKRAELKAELQEVHDAVHPIWGELMRAGLEKSRFARQVEGYACLYTTKVTNILSYSAIHEFRSPRDVLPHEMT